MERRQRRPNIIPLHSTNLYSPHLKICKRKKTLITQWIFNLEQWAERDHLFRPSNQIKVTLPKNSVLNGARIKLPVD